MHALAEHHPHSLAAGGAADLPGRCARSRCASCGRGFVVAFSCKGGGVCSSCNCARMGQTSAHLVDRFNPPVPVRQRVISVPKRLRRFFADRPVRHCRPPEDLDRTDPATPVHCRRRDERRQHANSRQPDTQRRLHAAPLRFGAQPPVNLYACAIDGVFMPTCYGPPAFLPVRPITQVHLATLAERVRRRLIRRFGFNRLLDSAVPPTCSPRRLAQGGQMGRPGPRPKVRAADTPGFCS